MIRKASLLIVIVSMFALLQACVVVDFSDGKYSYKEAAEKVLKHVDTISLDNFQGSVIIEPATDGKIKVQYVKVLTGESEARLREVAKKVTVEFHQGSKNIDIITDRPEPRPDGVNNMSVQFRICLPSDVRVNVKTANGSIDVSGMRDTMYLRSSNGGVTVSDVVGDLTVHTSNGSIEANQVSGIIDLESSNGRLTLTDVKGELQCDTSNGAIEITTSQLIDRADLNTSNSSIKFKGKMRSNGRYEMDTSNGSIDCWLDKNQGYNLYAKTSNGRVLFTFSTKLVGTYEKSYLQGSVLGGGANVSMRTSNSSINIHEMGENQ